MKIEHSKESTSQAVRITIESKEYESLKNILIYAREHIERFPYGLRHQQMSKDLEFLKQLMQKV